MCVDSRYAPEPDVGLDVADGKPRSGLAYPAEKEEVLPVRVLDPDVLECECRPCGALPAGSLDFDAMEQPIPENPPVAVPAGASRLPIFLQSSPTFHQSSETGTKSTSLSASHQGHHVITSNLHHQ